MNTLSKSEFLKKIELTGELTATLKKNRLSKRIKISINIICGAIVIPTFIIGREELFLISILLMGVIYWPIKNYLISRIYNDNYENVEGQINRIIFDTIFDNYNYEHNKMFPENKLRESHFWSTYKEYYSTDYLTTNMNNNELMMGKIKLVDWDYYNSLAQVDFDGYFFSTKNHYDTNNNILLLSNSTKWEQKFIKMKNHYLKKRYVIFTENMDNCNSIMTDDFLQTLSPFLKSMNDKIGISIGSMISIEFYNKRILKPKNINDIYNDYLSIIKIIEIYHLIDEHLKKNQ